MKFDSNRAWQDAMAAVKACRSLLVPVAGVFFLIPSVATSFFLGDVQARIMENMTNREVVNGIMEAEMGKIMGFGLGAMVAGFIGYLAVLVLLTDRSRPTVGEAIARGVFGVPTLAIGKELFWGADATPMAAEFLAAGSKFTDPEYARIASLPVGAARRPGAAPPVRRGGGKGSH